MGRLNYLLLTILLTSCGSAGENITDGTKCISQGNECNSNSGTSGETGSASAQQSSTTYIPGPQGIPGSSCSLSEKADVVTIACTDGSRTSFKKPKDGTPGRDGIDGATGPQGTAGSNGSSCTITQVSNGALISCSDGTSVVLLNGVNGTNGTNASQTPYTVVATLDPCGRQGTFDEMLLRLANGKILAHYSSGNKQFLTELSPGSYVTTDDTSCFFSIDSSMQIYNEHN